MAYHFSISLPPGVGLGSPCLVFIVRDCGFVSPLWLISLFFVLFQEVAQKTTNQLLQQQQQTTEELLSHRGLPENEVSSDRDLR